MAFPQVDKGMDSATQAVQKQTIQQYPMITSDMIDWDKTFIGCANVMPPIAPSWSNPEHLFDGNLNDATKYKPAIRVSPGTMFTIYLNRPSQLGYIMLSMSPVWTIPAPQVAVNHVDGTSEILTILPFTGFGRAYTPPANPTPIDSIIIVNAAVNTIDIYSIFAVLPNITVTSSGSPFPGIVASTNNFYSDEGYNVIPPGLLGITLVFGFSSEAFIFKNSSSSLLEISEDGGITWEKVNANDQVWFDAKSRTQIIVRDPLGVGGQAYRLWAW
jgi:hypothetical protein